MRRISDEIKEAVDRLCLLLDQKVPITDTGQYESAEYVERRLFPVAVAILKPASICTGEMK